MTVGFRQTEAIPHLAVSVLLLPETGINGLTLENASVLSVSGKQVLGEWPSRRGRGSEPAGLLQLSL